ncbi:hypothetical protein C3L29_036920, partial [Pseudomonas sp. MWU12-2534b]
ADVVGQRGARRALEVAAAGGPHMLMVGPPGAGKSMLAARLPGLLPPLTDDEALTSAALLSAGRLGFSPAQWRRRPFRAPHHSSSAAALVGGRASFDVTPTVKLFGQAYYAPSSFASGSVNRVNDYAAGVRWNVVGPLSVEAGYRYFDIRRDNDSRSRKLADG